MGFNVRSLLVRSKLVLAPLDGITDLAFREICEEMGAAFTISEMVASNALVRGRVDKVRYMRGNLRHNIVQLFGNDPHVFIKAAKIIESYVDGIDVNLGCPSSRLINNEMGGWLLNDPDRVFKIIHGLSKNLSVPVSAKIRIGFNDFSLSNYKLILSLIERAGASFVTIHGRTVRQGFSGISDWSVIKIAKDIVKIPVIGNGDVKEIVDLKKLEFVDALMIGRAAVGNPFIFENFTSPSFKQRVLAAQDYFDRAVNYGIEFKNVKLNVGYFFKGMRCGKSIRAEIFKLSDFSSLRDVLYKLSNFSTL